MSALRIRLPFSDKPNLRAFASNLGWLVADKVTRLFVAVFISADLICAAVSFGLFCFTSAATPAICGVEKLVPCETTKPVAE